MELVSKRGRSGVWLVLGSLNGLHSMKSRWFLGAHVEYCKACDIPWPCRTNELLKNLARALEAADE